jgi:hypothetical protein
MGSFPIISSALHANHKAERVNLSHGILSRFQSVRSKGFQSVITGDGSWFFLYYLRDSMRASSRDKVPERVNQKNGKERRLISLLWSVNGIHSLVDIPKGSTYTLTFFAMLSYHVCLTELLYIPENNHSKVFVHLDNARPDNARQSTECFHAKRSSGYRTRLTAQTSH